MDGIAVRAADTVGRQRNDAAAARPKRSSVVDTGDPLPDGFDAVVMREHVHYVDGRAELRAAVAPYQHVRSIGEDISATELLLPAGAPPARRSTSRRPPPRARPRSACAAQPVVAILPTGDEMRPIGSELAPGELLDTNSLMLAAQAREAGCEVVALPIEPDDEERIADAIRGAVERCDLLIVIAGSSAGRDDYTAHARRAARRASRSTASPSGPVIRSCSGAIDATPVIGAPGYPVSASLTFDIFAAPLLAELEGAVGRPRGRRRGHGSRARSSR